jgi:hypothetical protein
MIHEGTLSESERALIARARTKAHILYEGKLTPHRSCGVCLAETFGLPWRPYQALRRGGITGEGACGAIRAGEMILADLLGPERATDPVSEELKEAIRFYQARWKEHQARAGWTDTICNTLTAPFADFHGAERMCFCTSMAADAAELVAETLVRLGRPFEVEPFSASAKSD